MKTAAEEPSDAEIFRRRLEEAEETLRAIREGEIDALVISGGQREEVFTLEGGTESYRAFMESMDLGAAALDSSEHLLYANGALGKLLGRSAQELLDNGLFAAFDPETAATIRNLVAAAGSGKQTAAIKRSQNGAEQHLLVSSSSLRLGLTACIAVTFTDITERVRAAAMAESELIARAVIASANEAVVVCDRAGIITHSNAAVLAICEDVPIGKPFTEAIPLVFADIGLLHDDDLLALAVAGHPVQGMEATAPRAPHAKDLLVSAAPLVVGGEHIRGSVVTMVDLSQRKSAERQQSLLMAELDHRVRNTLTLVMSICSRSAHEDDTVESFQKAFMGRIQALAATHTLLAERSWNDVTIEEVLLAELAPYTSVATGHTALSGLRILVSPRGATALGLVFHELTTNAAKYGALSSAAGRLSVNAAIVDAEIADDNRVSVVIDWVETGGPPVKPPSRRGFGETIMSRSLSYAPDGGTEMEFRPEGVRCRIRMPRQDVKKP
jgi:PAS domain S-box-containing protein